LSEFSHGLLEIRTAAGDFPFKGVDGGVFEIALRYRGDTFRTLYVVKIDADIWVIHVFQNKSKSGIKTPHMEVDLIRERLRRLKEVLN
jgi:phage-related protein